MSRRRSSGLLMVAIATVTAPFVPCNSVVRAAVDPLPGVDGTYGTDGAAVLHPQHPIVVANTIVPVSGFGPRVVGSLDGDMAIGVLTNESVPTPMPQPPVRVPGIASDLVYSNSRGLLLAGVGDAASGSHPVVEGASSDVQWGVGGVTTVTSVTATGRVDLSDDASTLSGLAAISGGSEVFVAKFNSLGNLDTSWGTLGVTHVDLGAGDDQLLGVFGTDDKWIVGSNGGITKVVHLTAGGVVDTGFGTAGTLTPSLPSGALITSAQRGYAGVQLGGVDADGHGLLILIGGLDPNAVTAIPLPVDGSVVAMTIQVYVGFDVSVLTQEGNTFRWVTVTTNGQVAAGSSIVENTLPGVLSAQMASADSAWLTSATGVTYRYVRREPTEFSDTAYELDWDKPENGRPLDIAAFADGSSVLVGTGAYGPWVGWLSPSGVQSGPLGGNVARPHLSGEPVSVDVLAGNKLLVGTTYGSSSWLYRLDADGSIDTTFGDHGGVALSGWLHRDAIMVEADGSIVVVADHAKKLSADGVVDSTFGTGSALLSFGEQVLHIRRLPSGAIEVHVGGTGGAIYAARLTATGDLDPATYRTIASNAGSAAAPIAFAMPDGSISLAWSTHVPFTSTFNHLNFVHDDGTAVTHPTTEVLMDFHIVPTSGVAMSDGGVLVGFASAANYAGIIKLRSDFSLDRGFGLNGAVAGLTQGGLATMANGQVLAAFATGTPGAATATVRRILTNSPPLGERARYVALPSPVRLVNTRKPGGVALTPMTSQHFPAAGVSGIPLTATALATNFTLVGAAPGGGYGQLFGPGMVYPGSVSNVNLRASGGTSSSFAVVRIGVDGTVATWSTRSAHAVVDVFGYWVPASTATSGRYVAEVEARRLLDTRLPSGGHQPLTSTTPRTVQTGHGGVTAALVNITVVNPSANGYLQAYGSASPTTSNVNFVAHETRANLAIVPLTASGTFAVKPSVSTHVLIDIVGYFTGASAAQTSSGLFVAESPTRVIDTRIGQGGAAPVPGTINEYMVGGHGGVPPGSPAALISVVSVGAAGSGYLSIEVSIAAPLSGTSLLNIPAAGVTTTNSTIAHLSLGKLAVYTTTASNVVVDVSGWFVP